MLSATRTLLSSDPIESHCPRRQPSCSYNLGLRFRLAREALTSTTFDDDRHHGDMVMVTTLIVRRLLVKLNVEVCVFDG